jgi:hypothetical protein
MQKWALQTTDYGTTGPRDHETTGLRDYGTVGNDEKLRSEIGVSVFRCFGVRGRPN